MTTQPLKCMLLPTVLALLAACSDGNDNHNTAPAPTLPIEASQWRVNGGTEENTRHAEFESAIGKDNVDKLAVKWEYLTTPDLTSGNPAGNGAYGSITTNPAVVDDRIFFTDWSGHITSLEKDTGTIIWKKNFLDDISTPGFSMNYSRNTPAVGDNNVLVGGTFYIASPHCNVNQALDRTPAPSASVLENPATLTISCHRGDGAIVVALDKETGAVMWRTKVSEHTAAKITGSITIEGQTAYVPVASWEEDFSRAYPNIYDTSAPDYPNSLTLLDPPDIDMTEAYPCCSFRGKVVALNIVTGAIEWEHYTSIGNDPDNELSPALKAALGAGYWGVSTYGNTFGIDRGRDQLYYSTAQSYTAPDIVEVCEVARRQFATENPDQSHLDQLSAPNDGRVLPEGTTSCNALSAAFKTYHNSIVALDKSTGQVQWSFAARQYDAWVHACDPPTLGGGGATLPFLYADPISNLENCPELIGPDYGFGNQPMLLRQVSLPDETQIDLVVAGNKDGRLFALNPDNGDLVWKTQLAIGGILGGMQFGLSSDGERIYALTNGSQTAGRDASRAFFGLSDWLDVNFNNNPAKPAGFPGLRAGFSHEEDGDAGTQRTGEGPRLPSLAPTTALTILGGVTAGAGYPQLFPEFDAAGNPTGGTSPFITGPSSGPKEVRELINPPADVFSDCVHVFDIPIDASVGNPNLSAQCTVDVAGSGAQSLYTTAGTVHAVDAATGAIVWQRPATDGAFGMANVFTGASASSTVANGVLYVGYSDAHGTMVALDVLTGQKLFQFTSTIEIDNGVKKASGSFEAGPTIVGGVVYWGVGGGTSQLQPTSSSPIPPFIGSFNNQGNRLYAFELDTDGDGVTDSQDD